MLLQRFLLVAKAGVVAATNQQPAGHHTVYCSLLRRDETICTRAGLDKLQDLEKLPLKLPCFTGAGLLVNGQDEAEALKKVIMASIKGKREAICMYIRPD